MPGAPSCSSVDPRTTIGVVGAPKRVATCPIHCAVDLDSQPRCWPQLAQIWAPLPSGGVAPTTFVGMAHALPCSWPPVLGSSRTRASIKQTVRQYFRQCLIIAPRSSTCRVQLHWRLGQGADHGRMARVAEACDRSTAPGATPRSTISSASVRLQRLRLACRRGARLIPILATRHGRARPGHACLWTDILNPL